MQAVHIEAKTLPEAWYLCIKEIMAKGYEYKVERGSYAGQKRKEFDFVTGQVEFPGARPIVPDIPPGYGLPPPTTMEYVEKYYNRYFMTSLTEGNEQYTYGQDLEKQIPEIIRMFQEDGFETNQACMSVGNADSIKLSDPQCLKVVDVRIRYGRLHFFVYFRSWDLWGGFPVNLAGLQLLKEYMVKEINKKKKVEDGMLFFISKGLHLYDHCWQVADVRLGKF